MSAADKIKDAVGIEGNVKEFITPMVNYTCVNITLGGAGYPINLYHQQYLNFVEGLSTALSGTLSMINGVIDAISDVAMGIITDRTRSKYGKHRIYVLLGAVPFFISYIMKWCSFGVSSTGNSLAIFAYYLFTAILYSTSYTIMSVPHVAMLPTIEPHYFRRTQYKIVEYAFNSVGQLSSFIFMGLVLGGVNMDNPSPADRQKYMFCGIILGLWFLWSPIVNFFKCKEPSSLNERFEPFDSKYLLHEYSLVFKNRAFRQYFLIAMFNSFRSSFYQYADQYFMISIANKYSHFNVLNAVAGVAEFMGSPANYFLNRYFGKRISGTLFTPIMVAGLAIYAFIKEKTPVGFLYLAAILYNFGFSGPTFAVETIQPDITDVDELITGRRREGTISTFRSFVTKTLNSFMTGILGFMLKFFGYDVKTPAPAQQSAKTIFGIRLIFTYLPLLFGVLTWILVTKFKMEKKDHEEIQRVIKEKHERGECEITEEEKERLEQISGVKWENMWIGSPVTEKN